MSITPALPPILPVTALRSRPARLVAIEPEGPGVATYRFACDERLGFAPGQFNMIHLPGIGAAPISISSDPVPAATVAHTVRAVGNVTRALARLSPGAGIMLRGPCGTPWPVDTVRGRDVVVVAGGVGLASLRAAIVALARRRADYRSITLLVGAREPADLLYAREHAAWAASGIDVRIVVERATGGRRDPVGVVTDLVAGLDFVPARTSLFSCGPEPMMKAVAAAFQRRGQASVDMFLALERTMACAAGVCGLCQLGPAFVCRDGPVFRHDHIAPFLAVAFM